MEYDHLAVVCQMHVQFKGVRAVGEAALEGDERVLGASSEPPRCAKKSGRSCCNSGRLGRRASVADIVFVLLAGAHERSIPPLFYGGT